MVLVRAATLSDVGGIVDLALRIQKTKQAHINHPINTDHFEQYVSSCIASPGIYVFSSEDADGTICGLLIINEFGCPWNRNFRWASDLMFIAEKGGPKLLRLAKKMKEWKGWDKLMLSTTTTNERADKLYSHFGTKIGSVFELD